MEKLMQDLFFIFIKKVFRFIDLDNKINLDKNMSKIEFFIKNKMINSSAIEIYSIIFDILNSMKLEDFLDLYYSIPAYIGIDHSNVEDYYKNFELIKISKFRKTIRSEITINLTSIITNFIIDKAKQYKSLSDSILNLLVCESDPESKEILIKRLTMIKQFFLSYIKYKMFPLILDNVSDNLEATRILFANNILVQFKENCTRIIPNLLEKYDPNDIDFYERCILKKTDTELNLFLLRNWKAAILINDISKVEVKLNHEMDINGGFSNPIKIIQGIKFDQIPDLIAGAPTTKKKNSFFKFRQNMGMGLPPVETNQSVFSPPEKTDLKVGQTVNISTLLSKSKAANDISSNDMTKKEIEEIAEIELDRFNKASGISSVTPKNSLLMMTELDKELQKIERTNSGSFSENPIDLSREHKALAFEKAKASSLLKKIDLSNPEYLSSQKKDPLDYLDSFGIENNLRRQNSLFEDQLRDNQRESLREVAYIKKLQEIELKLQKADFEIASQRKALGMELENQKKIIELDQRSNLQDINYFSKINKLEMDNRESLLRQNDIFMKERNNLTLLKDEIELKDQYLKKQNALEKNYTQKELEYDTEKLLRSKVDDLKRKELEVLLQNNAIKLAREKDRQVYELGQKKLEIEQQKNDYRNSFEQDKNKWSSKKDQELLEIEKRKIMTELELEKEKTQNKFLLQKEKSDNRFMLEKEKERLKFEEDKNRKLLEINRLKNSTLSELEKKENSFLLEKERSKLLSQSRSEKERLQLESLKNKDKLLLEKDRIKLEKEQELFNVEKQKQLNLLLIEKKKGELSIEKELKLNKLQREKNNFLLNSEKYKDAQELGIKKEKLNLDLEKKEFEKIKRLENERLKKIQSLEKEKDRLEKERLKFHVEQELAKERNKIKLEKDSLQLQQEKLKLKNKMDQELMNKKSNGSSSYPKVHPLNYNSAQLSTFTTLELLHAVKLIAAGIGNRISPEKQVSLQINTPFKSIVSSNGTIVQGVAK